MFSRELAIKTIKVVDIIFITIIYFIVSFLLAFFLDLGSEKMFGFNYDAKSIPVLIGEVVSQVAALTVCAYFLRNLVQMIPFPFDGVVGFEHLRVKEVSSGALITTFGTIFFYDLQNKLHYIRQRAFPTRQKRISKMIHQTY